MSDLDKFIKLYKSVGIDLKPIVSEDGENESTILYLSASDKPKLNGYSCFFSEIYFDSDGKFISQGFWE